ncbi:hypothetical protein CRUP_022438 [Coryphaenoides rupestris]|nr:hypothetical protein CRUP_022438 [Coryphaenoides rupestris]
MSCIDDAGESLRSSVFISLLCILGVHHHNHAAADVSVLLTLPIQSHFCGSTPRVASRRPTRRRRRLLYRRRKEEEEEEEDRPITQQSVSSMDINI